MNKNKHTLKRESGTCRPPATRVSGSAAGSSLDWSCSADTKGGTGCTGKEDGGTHRKGDLEANIEQRRGRKNGKNGDMEQETLQTNATVHG